MKSGNSSSNAVWLTIMTCVALFGMQTIFLFIPADFARLYNQARPLVYAVPAIAIFVFLGIDQRHIPGAYIGNMVAVISIALLGMVFLFFAFIAGVGRNVMTLHSSVVIRNLWEHGTVVIIGEYIRYKLIKGTSPQHGRTAVIITLTLVLAYANMNVIRMMLDTDLIMSSVFFESIFRPLVISATASFFAVKGSLLSALIISFLYTMTPYLLPVIPDVTPLTFSLLITGMAFVSALILNFFTNEKKRALRLRDKRAARYAKKPVLGYGVTALIIGVALAFFMGVFPIYPVVVLTGSMEGTLERGSLAFVERVPPGEAFARVGEGEVIHFTSRGVPYIHRVVEFATDVEGNRQFITQGDASYLVDPHPVTQYDVLGIARASIPFFGWPYIFVRALFGV